MGKKHGLSKHPINNLWYIIKSRCFNKNYPEYHYYGGRGIKMCKLWENNFIAFYDWAINNGWEKGLQIDRINVNKGYSPKNCRFVDSKTNGRNKRNNIYVEYNSKKILLKELSEQLNIDYCTLKSRFYNGWPMDQISNQLTWEYRGSPIVQISKNKIIAEYKNITEAANAMNGKKQNISAVVRGRQKTAYGYYWEYKYPTCQHPNT